MAAFNRSTVTFFALLFLNCSTIRSDSRLAGTTSPAFSSSFVDVARSVRSSLIFSSIPSVGSTGLDIQPTESMSYSQSPFNSNVLSSSQTLDVTKFGANGADTVDDTVAVQEALKAAAKASAAQGNVNVNVFFPGGRYFLSTAKGIVVPSHVTLLGDTTSESIIVNSPPPGAEPFVFTTRDWNAETTYIPIARADDTSAHPALPNNSYEGLNYVYLKNRSDVKTLRNLGVPGVATASSEGLRTAVASGATLGNNYGTDVPRDSAPKLVLQKDNGVNPAPVDFSAILAVDDTGKVLLKDNNLLNWGVDAHKPGESLADYYNPSPAQREETAITGPAWLVLGKNQHHDIAFKNLVFEADLNKPNSLYGAYGLYLGYGYNITVSDCKFRNIPGSYPILAIRSDNVVIENNQFDVQGYRAITLDAGSNYTLVNNKFFGKRWTNGIPPQLPLQAINFIEFDENPININILNNQFSDLESVAAHDDRSGQAIAGLGGAYLKVANNKFSNISKAILKTFGFNHHVILDGNIIENSKALLFSGSGASMANLYNNRYVGDAPLGSGVVGFDSYNKNPNSTNYVVKNSGVTINQWYNATTYVAANRAQDGSLITSTNLINRGGVSHANDRVAALQKSSAVKIKALTTSEPTISTNSAASLTVELSDAAPTDFPLYLTVSNGDFGAVDFQQFLVRVPAGERSLRLANVVKGLKPGRIVISAKPLASESEQAVSANLMVVAR
jgi:hypothetical protein